MNTATVFSHRRPVAVRTVTLDHPWRWLAAGWHDVCAEPAVGALWGALFALIGFMLLFGLGLWGLNSLILPLGFGFVLVGPVAAVGLYETSRRLASGEEAGIGRALAGLGRNPGQITLVGLFLTVGLLAWMRLAMLEFALFFSAEPPSLDTVYQGMLLSPALVPFLMVGCLTGGAIAALLFAMTVVAVPMLVDRPDCDAMGAMLASLDATRRNWRVMLLWAVLIGLFTFVGLMFYFLGLVVTLPLVGHASWHAYRDLIVPAEVLTERLSPPLPRG